MRANELWQRLKVLCSFYHPDTREITHSFSKRNMFTLLAQSQSRNVSIHPHHAGNGLASAHPPIVIFFAGHALPLNKLNFSAPLIAARKLRHTMRISATCDANPNAMSGVALDATPDANLVAKSCATPSAVNAAN